MNYRLVNLLTKTSVSPPPIPRCHRRYVDVHYLVLPEQDKQFSLIDFGSAGGTFVRLATGVPTPMYPSMMIMLGKHQVNE